MMQLMGWDFNTALKNYGEGWRLQRRLYQQKFHEGAAVKFHPT